MADDVLHTIPFAALPDPNATDTSTYQPLMLSHEIINAPSASTIAILREQMQLQEAEGQRPGTKTLAVIADPVFGLDDARMTGMTSNPVPVTPPATPEPVIIDNFFLQQTWQQIAPETEQSTVPSGISRLDLTGEWAAFTIQGEWRP